MVSFSGGASLMFIERPKTTGYKKKEKKIQRKDGRKRREL